MVPQLPTPGNDAPAHSIAVPGSRARATADAEVADALRDLLAHDVAVWDRYGLERFKERTVRSVFRGRLGAADVHVKVFRADTIADRARDTWRQGRGEREAEHLRAARALGLPVVDVLAAGAAQDAGQLRSFLVTRTVAGAAPFTFVLASTVQHAVGALLRTVHERGLDLDDLHPGNLVVDRDGRPSLLDLTSMRHGEAPSLRRRAAALALFCQDLDGGALDPAARALLAGYRAAAPALPDAFAGELVLAGHRWRARGLASFGRRATRACRHTEIGARQRGRPRWLWHLPQTGDQDTPGDRDAMRAACEAFVGAPPAPERHGRRGAVWRTDAFAVKQRDRGAARTLWRAAYWLLFAGVPAPAPVALCLEPTRGLVFTRRVDGPTLAEALASGAIDPSTAARALGASTGRLHAHGLRNRDLKFENLRVEATTGRVLVVDLDGVRRSSCDDARGIGRDLGRVLAAFTAAGAPGGRATVRAFFGAWLRAHRALLRRPPWRRIRKHAEKRAREWASAHR